MKKPRIKFVYNSLEQEREMIDVTKQKQKWFSQNSYPYTLPAKNIKDLYSEEDYIEQLKLIKKNWEKIENRFFDIIDSIFLNRIKEGVVVHLTKYGVGGGYELPNQVYVNVDLPFDPILTIKHEYVHLMVEPIIKKYNIAHEKKEKIIEGLINLFN